ncbi:MAG: pilus assembly protein PilM [Phycisphaerales bacterium]
MKNPARKLTQPRRSTIAIDLSGPVLRAVEAEVHHGRLRVERLLAVDIPESVAGSSAAELGAWVRERLDAAGFSKSSRGGSRRAIVAVPREQVAMKRLTLPGNDPFDLPDMVRFAMQREVPFEPGEAVIDFVAAQPSRRSDETSVMAAAMRRERLNEILAAMQAAGLAAGSVCLRCLGVAELMFSLTDRAIDEATAWLGVDVTEGGVELCVLHDGAIRFSRAAAIPHVEAMQDRAKAVVTETRRSWMSYRIVEDAPGINGAVVFGSELIGQEAVHDIERLLGVRARAIADHEAIDRNGHEPGAAWPLLGLLAAELAGRDVINFASPTQAPDRHARTRQMVLAGVGAAIVIGAGAYAVAWKSLRDLRSERDELREQVSAGDRGFWQTKRDQMRLEHLRRWDQSTVDWLAHLASIETRWPGPESIVLDQWSGSLRSSEVRYDDRAAEDNRWSVPIDLTINLEGEATTRAAADAFRASFVDDDTYITAPSGPDSLGGKRYPYPFKLSLRSSTRAPELPAPTFEEQP